jgi:single-strand DNA-binding protein
MRGVNRVILVGRLGKDPLDRMTAGGTHVSNFSVATSRSQGGNGNGDRQEITDWHRIVVYGKTAECCNQYLKKGRLVCVEGSIQSRSWENPPGTKHYITEVVASRVQFLDVAGKMPQPEGVDAGGEDSIPF